MAGQNEIRYSVNFDIRQENLNKLKKSLKDIQNMKLNDLMKFNDNDIKKAEADLMKIKSEAQNVEKALKQAFNAKLGTINIDAFRNSLTQSRTSIEQVYTALSKAGAAGQSAFRNLIVSTFSTNTQLKETHVVLDKIAQTLSRTLGWNLASTAVNSLTRSVQQAWGYVKSLDTSLNNISIVTGKSANQMANFAIQANNAAKELGKTTTDYTKAALIFAQQGLDDKQIEKRTEIALKTASVTGQSTEAVSEELTAVWNGYKVKAEEAELYVDRLAAVASKTASNLKELSTGMSKVASAAAAMGVGEDQLAAQLSTIISVTRQAPESVGTALRTVYARISDIQAGIEEDGVTLGNYSGKMADLGFNVLDASGHLRDMGSVIEQIGGKWQDLTRQQQINLAQVMAGQRQYSNLIALFDNFDQYTKSLEIARNAEGTLQSQQDTYMESMTAHLNQLKAAKEDVFDSLINSDSMKDLVDVLTNVVELFANFVDSIGGGGVLLKSLGSIGMMAFSTQIAKGLNTAITNFEISNENAAQFQAILTEIENWKGIPGLDQTSKNILDNKQQFLQLSKMMSSSQFTAMQDQLNEIIKMTNERANLKMKQEMLNKQFTDRIGSNGQGLSSVMNDKAAQEAILNNLESQSAKFSELNEKLITYTNSFKQLEQNTNSGTQAITSNLQGMKESLSGYITQLSTLVKQSGLERHQNLLETLKKQLAGLDDSIPEEQVVAKLKAISVQLKGIATSAGTATTQLTKDLQAEFTGTAQSILAQSDSLTVQLQQKWSQWGAQLGRIFRTHILDNVAQAAGGIATLAMSIQQLKNIGSIWSNSDLTVGEKLLQTIMTLGMSVSMIIPSLEKLDKVFGGVNKAEKENVALTADVIKSDTASATASATAATAQKAEAVATDEVVEAEVAEKIQDKNAVAGDTSQAGGNVIAATTQKAEAEATKQVIIEQNVEQSEDAESFATDALQAKGSLMAAEANLKEAAVSFFKNLANPFTLAIVGAVAFIATLAAVGSAMKKIHEQRIKEYQEQLEKEQQLQDEIHNNNEMLSSLDELNEKYQQHEITRSQLKTSIQELIEQYGLEKSVVDELCNSYDNLSDFIVKQRLANAKAEEESLKREKESADALLDDTAESSKYTETVAGTTGQKIYLKEISNSSAQKKLFDILQNSDFEKDFYSNGLFGKYENFSFDAGDLVHSTAEDYIAKYDTIMQLKEKIAEDVRNGVITREEEEAINASLQALYKWADEIASKVEEARAVRQQMELVSAEVRGFDSLQNGTIDFSKVKDVNQYYKQRLALINEIIEKDKLSESEATKKADLFLEHDFQKLHTQYGQTAKLIDEISKATNTSYEQIGNLLKDLNENQISALLKIDWDTVDTLGLAAHYIQEIADADLSHTAKMLDINPDALLDAASEKYQNYQEIEDKVKSGKGLSTKEFEYLDPELQQYFRRAANGTYKLEGSIQDFTNAVDKIKIQGFVDNLDLVNRDLEKIQAIREKGWDENYYNSFNKNANELVHGKIDEEYNHEDFNNLIQGQLEYFDTLGATDKELALLAEDWRRLYDNQQLSSKVLDDMYNKYVELDDQTQDLAKRQEERLKQQTEYYHQLHDAMFPTDSDVDQGALQSLSGIIQEMADSSVELDDNLDQDTRAADDLAEAILRFDDAITDVTDNYEDWLAALNSGSAQDQAEVIDGLRDAYADLLDMDASALPDSFLKSAENLELMKAAIDGDVDAYDQLLERAGQSVLMDVGLNTDKFFSDRDMVQDAAAQLAGQDFGDIQIGAALNDENFLNALTNMVNAAGMTAQQATDYLASMGVDAEVVEQKSTGTETKQQTGWQSQLVPDPPARGTAPAVSGLGGSTMVNQLPLLYQTYSAKYTPNTSVITDTKENTAFSLKVTSAHKSSGGGFKYSQASHGGGSKKPTSKGSGGKGGGGKGGGSGKAPEPDTSQKDRKKDLQDTRDIYHDINVELKQINRQLKRAQQKQDRLYGKQLLDNLNEQNRILEKNKVTLQEKHKIQEQDLKTQQEALKNLGVTFDAYGNIANYMDVLGKKQAQITAETAKYNSLIDAYNASTDKDLKKALADEAGKIDKKIKEFDDEYKNLEKKIKNYDSLREAMEDVVDQIEEQTQKQIEINIKKFRMAVEIQLEMGQAERDWNKFRREVLEHTDVLKGTEFEEIFANARQSFNDVFSYFDVHGTKGSLQALTEQLMATRAEIEAINETGKSAIYGDNKAQAMEDLQKDLDELMGQMEDVQGLIDDIGKAYLDTIDDIADQFDKQIEDYEYVGDLIEHDIDLLSLLYGDKNYDAMQKYYDALARNNLKQLDSLKQQRDFWKQEWEEAVARGDSKAAEQFEQNYKETIKNLNDLIEDSAKTIQDKYVNAIDKIFDELDKKISNGKGTDYLSTQWDLMNKNAEEYLDTINSAFAIQETERKYQKAIDESKNIKSQQTLKKLMDDQLNILRNKEKVSQYDVDRAEKLLQVEQARIALQDAQSAKTTMRLKRDSQGNYSYQYVADNNAVDDARDNLAQAQNDLYNFDKERYQSVLNDMLSAWKDFQSEYKEILEDTSLAEEERIEKLALLRDEYGEYINDKTAQNAEARNNLMESAFADMAALYNTDVANYNQMSIDEQNILMGDLVPAWESGIQQMSDKVAGEGGFIPVCEQAFDSITEATKDYEEQLDNMANAAGISLDYVTQGVDLLSYAFENLIENNDDLIDRMYSEVDAIETLQDVARGLVDEYQNVYNEAKTAVSEIHNFIQEEQGRAAAYAETANAAIESYHRTAQAYADAYDQMASAFENYAARVRAAASGDSSSGGSNGGNGGTGGGTGGTGATSSPSGNKSSKSSGNNKEIIETEQGLIAGGEYYKKYYYDSGGYTGNWHSTEGRPAILHQKELVLNENDTKNFLEGTRVLREISSSLQGSLYNRIDNIGLNSLMPTNKEELEQNVHIEASFPNVNSKKEIEEAFNDLVNLAAQRAMRNN